MKQQTTLHAGVAKRDITTDDPSARVHDRLYAKALALDDGNVRLVIVALDAVAIGGICDIGDGFLSALRSRVEHELQIPGGNVLVHATHTHPPGRLLCDDAQQIDRTFDAIRRALQGMTPVKVGVGRGKEDRISINRTLRLANGEHWTIRQANPCPPDEEMAGLGPMDPEIGVVRIDRLDGRPLAVVYNYACHPLIGVPGGCVTANYPGFASRVIEENLGNDAMALFLQGAAGDVTEVRYKDINHPKDSESIGTMLGLSTLAAVRNIKTSDASLSIASQTVELPRRNDLSERLEALLAEQADLLASLRFCPLNFKSFIPLYLKHLMSPTHPSDYAYAYMHAEHVGFNGLAALDALNRKNLDKYLNNIRAMEKLTRIQDQIATLNRHRAINEEAGAPTISAEVQGIRIGDCVLITAPIEILTEVSLNIKRASPYDHTFMVAFSNGYMHYGPPAADYLKRGYEVTECFLAPQWQELYETTADAVIRSL